MSLRSRARSPRHRVAASLGATIGIAADSTTPALSGLAFARFSGEAEHDEEHRRETILGQCRVMRD